MDQEQFKSKVLPLRSRLFFTALKMLEEECEAEDITQEVLLKLWAARAGLARFQSLEAAAVAAVKNACIDRLRVKEREKRVSATELHLHPAAGNPYLSLEQKNTEEILERIIAKLPPLQQAVIRMKDVEGMETDEIAAITGTVPEAVRMNLSRARKKVREEYLKQIK